MEIVYFFSSKSGTPSIEESFRPIIKNISSNNDVKQYHVPCAGGNPIAVVKNILFIRRHSTKEGINHITGVIHYGVLGLLGRKSVLTIHDDYAIRQARHGLLDKIFKWLFWIFLPIKLASAVICITPSTKDKIYGLYRTNKLRVYTHHAISELFGNKRKPFNKECPHFLQIGTDNNKNLETTLRALVGLRCTLTVLKKMSLSQIKLAEELNITFCNKYNLPFSEVVDEYNKCDIVLFPSLFEGLGMPIYEAQASGKPVITTDAEPMNWVAGDGAALLSNPLNVKEYRLLIDKIIKDDVYRDKLVQNGMENARRFRIDERSNGYMEIYREILKQ